MMALRRVEREAHARHAAWLLGTVLLSVLTTLLVQRLLAPGAVAAQSGQAQVLRASAFELLGPGGGVVGRLTADSSGSGALALSNGGGQQRAVLTGDGTLAFYDGDGQILRLGMGLGTTQFGPGISIFGSDGRTRRLGLGLSPSGNPGVVVFDADGRTVRLWMGMSSPSEYGITILDGAGQPVAALP